MAITTLTNSFTLPPDMIESILDDHDIPHKKSSDGKILALDMSYTNNKVIKVWVFAPTFSTKLFDWLGY